MPRFLALPLVFAVCLSQAATAETPSWTQFRGDSRDGKAVGSQIRTDWESNPPTLAWKSDGFGDGYASLSAADGVLYTTGNLKDGQYAFAASQADGSILWKTRLTEQPPKHGYQGSRTTPTIDGDRLYLVSSDGAIHCLKRDGGEIVWSRGFKDDFGGRMSSGWGYSESPLIDGNKVLCTPGAQEAMIVALNKTDGETIWEAGIPDIGGPGKAGAGYSSIVVSEACGVRQYVQLIGQGVIGVRASDGEYLWGYTKVANRTANIPTPLAFGDQVFASSGYGTGSVLLTLVKDGDGVAAKEEYFLGPNVFQVHHGGMIYKDGYIYAGIGHNDGFPACLEVATGDIAWSTKAERIKQPGRKSSVVTYVDGHLIFRFQSGPIGLVELTPKEFVAKGAFTPDFVKEPSWSQVIVLGGKLYFREAGVLMCYDASAK